MLTSGVCLLFCLFILACSWSFLFIYILITERWIFFYLIKINKPALKNNFRNITLEAQRKPLYHSHVQSPWLLPSRTQVTQWLQLMTLQWHIVITQSPYVISGSYLPQYLLWTNRWWRMFRVRGLDRGLSLSSNLSILCLLFRHSPPCPLATTDLFTASIIFDISRKSCLWNHTECSLSNWLISERGLLTLPPHLFKAF